MHYATVQPGRIIHTTFPRLGWMVPQLPERVRVIKDYQQEQMAEIQMNDGTLGLYHYTGRLEVTR